MTVVASPSLLTVSPTGVEIGRALDPATSWVVPSGENWMSEPLTATDECTLLTGPSWAGVARSASRGPGKGNLVSSHRLPSLSVA